MFNPVIHYRSHFCIEKLPIGGDKSLFQLIVKLTGKWLRQHNRTDSKNEQIFKTWLFKGGEWYGEGGVKATTVVRNYNDEKRSAGYWAIRFEHNDSNFRYRRWRVDVTFQETDENTANISTTVFWYIKDGYLGKNPDVPDASVPNLVRTILKNENIKVTSADKLGKIIPTATKLNSGDGKKFYNLLISEERTLPIILINLSNSEPYLIPDGLQNLVLGSAFVYWYDNEEIHKELKYEWGHKYANSYSCGQNKLRIYQSRISVRNPNDWKKHRFFDLSEYNNVNDINPIVVQSIFRINNFLKKANVVYSIDDVTRDIQIERLSKLKSALTSTLETSEYSEYIKALEQENERLTEKNRSLAEDNSSIEDKFLDLEIANEQLEKELRQQEREYSSYNLEKKQLSEKIKNIENLVDVIKNPPDSVEQVLRILTSVYADRIFALDDAYESASECSNTPSDIWKLLVAFAIELHDLYFSSNEQNVNIEKEFQNRTGLELTLKESKTTKADSKLMAKRLKMYKGYEINISPHIKLDKNGKSFRLHYYADNTDKVLVIGHCGSHIETAGTRRRKEK